MERKSSRTERVGRSGEQEDQGGVSTREMDSSLGFLNIGFSGLESVSQACVAFFFVGSHLCSLGPEARRIGFPVWCMIGDD